MTTTVTITKPGVYSPFGILYAVGSQQTVSDEFGRDLIQSSRAVDTNGALGLPGNAPFFIEPPPFLDSAEVAATQALVVGAGISGVTNLAALRPWYDAYADARNTPVLIQGGTDSITFGLWSDNVGTATDAAAAPNSWPSQLAAIMNAQLGVPNTFSINGNDGRNSFSGSTATAGFGLAARSRNHINTNTTTITTPACTALDIIYYESNGSVVNGNTTPTTGSATYNIDAAGAVAITYAASVDTYKKVTVSGLPNTAHSVVIAGTTANSFSLTQINAHSGAGVIVGRSGVIGNTLSDSLGESTFNLQPAAAQARLMLGFAQGLPNLVILIQGQNECSQQNDPARGPQTPAGWALRIQAVANLLNTFGIPLLLISEPDPNNSDSGFTFKYRDYWAVARALATPGSNIAHLSIADYWGNFAASSISGYQNGSSGVHPLRKGYGSMASLLAQVLGRNPLYRTQLLTGA